ncbi:type I 3-dehydroquinate dehydratase [Chlamydiifrater phoenicopteri]|uniref:type I 3-dehydroquinate dehydratase n=1 Tax=Chlamydiifrater phoenicopteri TaxID=2681469 RepID=UPI001BCE3755|nr:type I 3-dehydroquinate dehydratase [Chlamydiifrater phoenicopteri]
MSLLCAVISESSLSSIIRQIQRALCFADLLEFRLDKIFPNSEESINSVDFHVLRKIREVATVPIIINCPYKKQFHSLDAYLSLIKKLTSLRPDYLDIDVSVPSLPTSKILQCYKKIKVIRSTHLDQEDLHATTLPEIYFSMKRESFAHLHKVVIEANSSLKTLELFSQSLNLGKDLIFLCSGENGSSSRVLSPIRENPINYAYVPGYAPVANGQLSTKDLFRHNYRHLNKHSSILGLIGNPIKNSIGHIFHNYFLSKKRLNTCYLKLETPLEDLKEILRMVKVLPFKGLSVTAPLKSAILPFVDSASSFVKKVGAANTLVIQEGHIHAFNTDGIGCLRALQRLNIPLEKIAILGFGGAGRAIALAMASNGSKVSVYNRTINKFPYLSQEYPIQIFPLDDLYSTKTTYDLLISTLPPNISIDIPMHITNRFMDLTTFPRKSPNILLAQKKNIPIVYGYQMFFEQALDQIHLWFPNTLSSNTRKKLLKKTEYSLFFS